jgi:TonB family protein
VANTAQSANPNDLETRSAAAPTLHGRAPILYVLSSDDTLLLELGPLLGSRYRTRPIDSAEQIAPASVTPWALMIDAAARPDARAQAARVKQQYPLAPLLVICADGTTADWANPLARGALTAIVERGALGSDAFEAALSSVDRQMAADSAASHVNTTADRPPWLRPAVLIIVVTSVLAVAGAWYVFSAHPSSRTAVSKPTPRAPPSVVPAAVPPAVVAAPAATSPRSVLELLSDARVAFRDGKSLLPPTDGPSIGNSALELYAKVLAQDPQNEEAHDGLRRLFTVASARIRADLNANKVEEAGRLLSAFHGVSVDPAAVATLESEIAAARPRALQVQARAAIAKGDAEGATQLIGQLAAAGGDRAAVTDLRDALDTQRNATRLSDLANHARALIKAGALLEPTGDSAQSAVLAMQQLNRGSPLTLNTQRDLQAALIERTLAASRAGQYDIAQQLLNSASILGNGPELAAARTQVQTAIDASRARPAAATVAPPPVEAAASAPDFVRAKPVAPLEVAYPQRAFDAGQSGYVIVEFTLDAKGHASDPKVIESDPPRVFDGAALQAVRHGYFDTSELGASGASRRARLRIAFKPVAKPPAE